MDKKDGVIKFRQEFVVRPAVEYAVLRELNAWRRVLFLIGLLGRDSQRYGGAAYGNVSHRLEPFDAPERARRFVISGSQTSGLEKMTAEHYTSVLSYDPERNMVAAEGPIEASSESMTHGAVYDADAGVRAVFHVHSPTLWRRARELGMPCTRPEVAYGTVEMAEEVKRLFVETAVREKRIFSMGGHEDGIVAFGRTAEEAGMVLLNYFAVSYH